MRMLQNCNIVAYQIVIVLLLGIKRMESISVAHLIRSQSLVVEMERFRISVFWLYLSAKQPHANPNMMRSNDTKTI